MTAAFVTIMALATAGLVMPVNEVDQAWSSLADAENVADSVAFSAVRKTVVELETRQLLERGSVMVEKFRLPTMNVFAYTGPPSIYGRPLMGVYFALISPDGALQPPTLWELASAFPEVQGTTAWVLVVHGCDLKTGQTFRSQPRHWESLNPKPPSYDDFKRAVIDVVEHHEEFAGDTAVGSTPNQRCVFVDGLAPFMKSR